MEENKFIHHNIRVFIVNQNFKSNEKYWIVIIKSRRFFIS